MLYQSNSGIEFLDALRDDQQKMIMDYINPEQWAIKFTRDKEIVKQIKELLQDGGY
jgi:lipid A disaccharide synthetase